MTGDDDEKTVIGGKLPVPGGPLPNPLPPLAGMRPPPAQDWGGPGGDEARTQIGGSVPLQPPHAAAPGDGWGLEQLTPQGAPPPPETAGQPRPPPGGLSSGGPPRGGSGFTGAQFSGQRFDASLPPPHPPPLNPAPRGGGPGIPLSEALRVQGPGGAGFHNPLLGAAAELLLLFGRLRAGQVALEVPPLRDHVLRAIQSFEQQALAAGASAEEVKIAQYMLCGTADDIVQNLPSAERALWTDSPMVARFFNVRTSGVGFFEELEKAQRAPAQRANLLEFALVCISLGFEGKYRALPNGARELQGQRIDTYDSLRAVRPRAETGLSPRWLPVVFERARRFGGVSVLAVAGLAGLAMAGGYTGLSVFLSAETAKVGAGLQGVVPEGPLTLLRPEPPQVVLMPAEVPKPQSNQSERLAAFLAPEISEGKLELDRKGDYHRVRLNNSLLFKSGKVDLLEGFAPLAARLSEALNTEPGAIRVQGFTDNDPVKKGGRFKDNLALSLARAEAVKTALAAGLADPARLEAEGRGETEPLGDNKSAEGKAKNRRVEILLLREEIARR